MATREEVISLEGREVRITNPDKVFFPRLGYTKLDMVRYYLEVMPGALRGVYNRPMVLKRFVNGAEGDAFFQKRAPQNLPPGVTTARIRFPSGRWADLVVCDEPADLAWVINLGCIDLNPWPVRADDVDRPDELRIDLDPTPEATFDDVKEVAMLVNGLLEELGCRGYPKTSGSRGIHINVRIKPAYDFSEVRRAALAIAREIEMRAPGLATSAWWKEERGTAVFIDYNQNARDRTVASAYSLRPTADARVSCPVTWEELPGIRLGDFTIDTVPQRFKQGIDPDAAIDDVAYSLDPLLELVRKHEEMGLGEGAYPPQFPKAAGEPRRVQPSRARRDTQEPTPPPMHTPRTGPKRFNEADGRLPPKRSKRARAGAEDANESS